MSSLPLSLHDYLHAIKMLIDECGDESYWLIAEIQAVNTKGGHYYFELAERQNGQIIASCRGTLWRYPAQKVINAFTKATGTPPQAGMSLLLKGKASFHPQYGFSINITDINPSHTLGQIAQAYQAMLDRLYDDGLIHTNKSLPMPFDLRHIIVIAPKDGAGLGDFKAEADRLTRFGVCQFHYHNATFQGNHAPQELREAITFAVRQHQENYQTLPDLLIIIRGGGAVGDLAYLNDYELACLVAEQPMPVWVGIGHERDRVILDEVAHTSFDTPSKVIFGIEKALRERLHLFKTAINTIKTHSQKHLAIAKNDCQTQKYRTQIHAQRRLSDSKYTLHHCMAQHKNVLTRLTALREHCRHLQSMILLSHPKRTLTQGYAIVRQHGKVINLDTANVHEKIDIEFFNGKMTATIDPFEQP